MKTELVRRRVRARYSAADRERWVREQAESGLTKKAFCERAGINLGTFHSWRAPAGPVKRQPAFAEVEVTSGLQAAVELLLPNGVRVGLRHQGRAADLAALIREVGGC